MAGRPSDPLLRLLRDKAREKGLNTAALAREAGIDRSRLKHVLAGAEPLTVDDMIALSRVLGLAPGDLTGTEIDAFAAGHQAERPPVREATEEVARPADGAIQPDPYGNHAEQILRLAFALGCDLVFLIDPKSLGGPETCGVPADVLARYSDGVPIRLDAAFQRQQDPHFHPDAFEVTLSFDRLTTCRFPWAAIRQVVLFPLAAKAAPEPTPPAGTPPGGRPRRGNLRLVE